MNAYTKLLRTTAWMVLWLFILPASALATQGHGGIEGVWVHQFAHLFFLFSMALLIFWLRQAGLVREPGWRYIQYAAVFFMIWNMDAVLVHFLDEQLMAVTVNYTSPWQVQIAAPQYGAWLSTVYFLAKLDHIFSVPGMVCLMLGLRHMLRDKNVSAPEREIRP